MAVNDESDSPTEHRGKKKVSRSAYIKALRQAYLEGSLTVDSRQLADRIIHVERELSRGDRKK